MARYARAREQTCGHCWFCGCQKPCFQAVVLDAGQFFETVQPRMVVEAARALVHRARSAGHPEFAEVAHTQRRITWGTQSGFNRRQDTSKVSMDELLQMTEALE
eukprot:1621530-Alexandrium_andersonii.AAC.1